MGIYITLRNIKADRENLAAQRSMQESAQKLRSVSANALDGVIMVDSRHEVTFWNTAVEKIFGYGVEEALKLSEWRLRKAQSVGGVGTYGIDLATRTVWGSEEGVRIYGLENQDSLTVPLEVVQAVPLPNERPHLDQAMHLLLSEAPPTSWDTPSSAPATANCAASSPGPRWCATSKSAP